MTANEQGHAHDEAFFERFRDDQSFAEAVSSAASMTAALALAGTYGYIITPEALVHAAAAIRPPLQNPLLRNSDSPAGQFVATDPGDY